EDVGNCEWRGESLQAPSDKLCVLSFEVPIYSKPAGVSTPPLCLDFSANACSDELREVQALLAASPGQRSVQLIFETAEGETLRVDTGAAFHVSVTAELEEQLQRWLITAVDQRAREAEQRKEAAETTVPRALEY